MPEQMIDIAHFEQGIGDVPAFGAGGASSMRNYVVDYDGEVLPRKGYQVLNPVVYHISSDGFLSGAQEGPLVIVDNSEGIRLFFRLPLGATYVLGKDRLFFTVPPQPGSNLDPSAYWVDLSLYPITDDSIFRWSSNTDRGGDHVRPSSGDTYFRAKPVHAGIVAEGVSHPVILGLTGSPPNSQNPIEIAIRTGGRAINNFTLKIVIEKRNEEDDIVADFTHWGGSEVGLLPNTTYVYQWAGQDGDYHNVTERAANLLSDYWAWLLFGAAGAIVDRLFLPDPDSLSERPEGEGKREITQEEFENCFLELDHEGDGNKYRYYLRSHRDSNTAGEVSAAIQAGLTVAGVAPANPYALGAGAVVAVAGTAGSLINRAREGERVRVSNRFNTPLRPAEEEGGGFQTGQFVFCHTYSNQERTIETIPSRTTEMMMFDFPNVESEAIGRTRQRIELTLFSESGVKSPNWDWATHVNIYAARTDNPDSHGKLPQETGLDFRLVQRVDLSSIGSLGYAVLWTDELFYAPDGSSDDPPQLLTTYDNDAPSRMLDKVTSYGSRIWGVNVKDNSVRYSKLGPIGYHFFPRENALIPQVLTFDDDHSPIVHLHPASNDSMLYVFKNDVIHILRGHGEIRGLYNPNTPVDVDIDASVKIENTGTSSPRSVCSLKNMTMFVGSDRVLYSMSGIRVTPFSLRIQPYIERLTDEELENVFAFEYRNCYHLCLPGQVLVLDLQKKYWTIFDWDLKEAFWAQTSFSDGAKLYAVDSSGRILELYTDVSDEGNFACEWESNPDKGVFQGIIGGLYVFHDGSSKGKLQVSLKMNNGEYITKTYTPALYNRFRQGFHGVGHRFQVKIRDENPTKLRIDRIQLGVEA